MEAALLALRGFWALIPKWLIAAALAAALALSGYVGVKLVAAEHAEAKAKTELSDERVARANENQQRAQVALEAGEKFRQQELAAARAAQENDRALKKAIATRDANHRLELAAHDELLHATEAFLAAGRTDVPEACADDLRAERDKSAALGRLFGEADKAAGELADAAERHADEVRGLKRQLELDRQAPEAKP